jgi:hypothetical protein
MRRIAAAVSTLILLFALTAASMAGFPWPRS